MSRSYRKPWVKDNDSTKYSRTKHHRSYRARCKQEIHRYMSKVGYEEFGGYADDMIFMRKPSDPYIPHKNEITNPWDIYDYKFYWDFPEFRRK